MPSAIEKFEAFIGEFERVLDDGPEQPIHEFIEQHPWILRVDSYGGILLSKYRLADKFIPDFVVIGSQRRSRDPRPLITFVEIERANERLYTKSDDPTAFLSHAIQQTQDW